MNNDNMKDAKTMTEGAEQGEGRKDIEKMMDLKFLEQRRIFLWGSVDDDSAKEIVNKLFYLENEKPGEKITFFINSPGGVVTSGYSILDTMNLISSPVATVCMGLAASMGSILLSAGEKGERYIYPRGEVMIHQPSIGFSQGHASDLEIQAKQLMRARDVAAEILSENCKQSVEQIMSDFDRDYWMNSEESVKYGIVDKVYSL